MDVSSLHSEAASHAGEGSSDQMAELRMTWLLGALVPKALQKTLISQALLHKNDFVLLAALQLLTAALDRVQRCVSRGHWEEAEREELSKESSPSALPSQEAAKRRRGAKRGGKEEGEGDGKAEGDGEEVSKEEDGNANAAEEVDEAEVMQLLELPPGGLESHVIFTAWCGAAQRYLEVLPRSALDVKFDWSKLLAAVAAPLLAATGHASSSGKKKRTLDTATGAAAFTKLLACSRCVGAAMRCGGRMEGMQLSKSQLSWAETLLRLRAAASSSQEPAAAELLSECGTSLQSCLRGLAVLGSEEDVELAAWLSQLCQPGCAPFFCQALQAVASKPGSFVSLTTGFETARAEEHGGSALHKPSGMPSASLLLSAALRQLTRRDPQAIALQGDSKPEERQKQALLCAEFIGALVKQLATLLPQAAPEFASLVESIGSWTAGSAALQTPGPEEGQQKRPELSALSAEGNSGAEAVRQTLLIQLRGLCEMWKCQGDASKKPKKARDSSTEFAQVVQDAVQSLGLDEGKQDDEGVALAETSLAARTFQTVLTIQQSSPHGHCSMYVLLEGARASSRRQDFLATSWYLLSLASLAAALAPNQSKKGRASSDGSGCLPPLRYALAHPVWSDLVSSTSTSESEHSLCLALAFGALWRLLQASAELGLRGDKEASGCHDTLLLKLWRRAASFGELLETSIAESFGDPVACWAANPTVALLANGVVSASRNASDLLERLGQELQELGTPIKLAVVEALLLDAEKGPAFLNLGVERRASLMRLLADTTLTGNKKAKQRAGQSLQKALALDRGGLLRMSLTSTGELPWPGSSEQGLSLGLVPLLEQACWVNPSLRREVVRQLEWGTSDPSAVLHMAAALAPFETTMPFLQDAAVKSIEPLALRPLPSDQRLCRLFELHPAPALEKLVRSAMGDTADEQGSKSKTISRLCFSLRLEQRRCRSGGSGRQPQLEQAILRYLDADHASDAVMASQSAMSVARALQDLGQVPSSALQQRLQSQIEALLAATETHEAAAILLWGLLPQRPAEAPARVPRPAAWQVSCAQKLLEEGDVSGPSGQPEWLLAHATRWWPHLLQGKRGVAQAAWQKKFVAQVRKAYKASLSMADRLRRQILIGYAAGDASIASADSTSSRSPVGADADSWSFRSWCELLLPWDGQPAPYEWDLDQQRLRATTDTFFFDRSMADPVPRVSQGRCVANEPKEQAVPDSGGKDEIDGEVATVTAAAGTEPRAYDIGYLVPFFAGQLRILGAEYSKGNENARRIVGPTVSALASGGGLELLLLACACSDETLRACAFEALSVVMLLVSYWNVDLLEEDTDEEDAEEAGVDDSKGGGKGKAGRGRGGRVLRRTQAPATGRLPFRELPELVRLLRYVRDAIRPPAEEGGLPAALPRLTVSFESACVPVLLQPHHFLYMRLSKFMFGRPAADLEDTPLFYKLMLAGEPDSSQDARLWLIRVIRRALVLRGPTHKPGADKAAGGDKLTRLALARRYVVPWLLSFAGSRELGSFPVWTEAITCLVAALSAPGPAAVGSALSLSVAEWAAGQAERTWPGRQSQRLQALRALGRLVSILLRLPSRSEGRKRPANSGPGANGGPELLALGSAVEALVSCLRRLTAATTTTIITTTRHATDETIIN
ncbi:unnamed protein product [Polarella glacialis]|uniref:URB1 C-terminal domain-containing protein n=1 Tax=Polarella glacialis TaxID=89957 RepID=A0A813DZ76_POLGL|nr:unnamed protein product [Polarella glacialis]